MGDDGNKFSSQQKENHSLELGKIGGEIVQGKWILQIPANSDNSSETATCAEGNYF